MKTEIIKHLLEKVENANCEGYALSEREILGEPTAYHFEVIKAFLEDVIEPNSSEDYWDDWCDLMDGLESNMCD